MNIPVEYSMQLPVSFNITTNQRLVNQWILVVRMDATAPVESDIIIPIKCYKRLITILQRNYEKYRLNKCTRSVIRPYLFPSTPLAFETGRFESCHFRGILRAFGAHVREVLCEKPEERIAFRLAEKHLLSHLFPTPPPFDRTNDKKTNYSNYFNTETIQQEKTENRSVKTRTFSTILPALLKNDVGTNTLRQESMQENGVSSHGEHSFREFCSNTPEDKSIGDAIVTRLS